MPTPTEFRWSLDVLNAYLEGSDTGRWVKRIEDEAGIRFEVWESSFDADEPRIFCTYPLIPFPFAFSDVQEEQEETTLITIAVRELGGWIGFNQALRALVKHDPKHAQMLAMIHIGALLASMKEEYVLSEYGLVKEGDGHSRIEGWTGPEAVQHGG